MVEERETQFETTNINTLWLMNIFENLKNLEEMERLAREGVNSLMDFAQIHPRQRELEIPELKYKNLKMMVSEMYLLLTDLQPVTSEEFNARLKKVLDKINDTMDNRKLFLHEPYNQREDRIHKKELTKFYFDTLRVLHFMRKDIIKEISPILYLKEDQKIAGMDVQDKAIVR